MRRIQLALILLPLLIGCALRGSWHKEGSTERDFKMDRGQCGAQAHAGGATGLNSALAFEYCMEGKGWTLR